MRRLLISAAHKSSGKTILSVGISAALTHQGMDVQTFKKGPDYIDPMWLAQASGRPCFNLDPYLTSWGAITDLFQAQSQTCDIQLVEANKGLFDGITLDGSDSNAALARHLDLPVFLVIDARGMTRGVAPLLLGYQAFDPQLNIAGVILNRVGGTRHETKLRTVIEHYTNLSVIGSVGDHPELNIDERHLGLIPSNEAHASRQRIAAIAQVIHQSVDLDRLIDGAKKSPIHASTQHHLVTHNTSQPPVRIAIAKDSAFGFYYADDLQALQAQGAELVPFNTLTDTALPADIDGLLIGGGFPETHMMQLQANHALRSDIRQAIANGLPSYAECGGLMYLSRSISWNDQRFDMVGAIQGDVLMHARPVGRGYVHLQASACMPWPHFQPELLRAHEFHYSRLINLPEDTRFAWKVQRGVGIDQQHDGLLVHNLLASYSHLRNSGAHHWTHAFIGFVRQIKHNGAYHPAPKLKVAA